MSSNKTKIQISSVSNLNRLMMRRVLQNKSGFVCGICRSQHSSHNDATACMHSCWQSLISCAPWVVETRGFGKQRYACAYCRRNYSSPELAQSCAEDCVARISKSTPHSKPASAPRMTHSFGKRNLRATFRLAFRQLIARAKKIDLKSEHISNGKTPETESFACEHCNSPHPSPENAAACLASHSGKEQGKT